MLERLLKSGQDSEQLPSEPTWAQMEEDLRRAAPNDVIFSNIAAFSLKGKCVYIYLFCSHEQSMYKFIFFHSNQMLVSLTLHCFECISCHQQRIFIFIISEEVLYSFALFNQTFPHFLSWMTATFMNSWWCHLTISYKTFCNLIIF